MGEDKKENEEIQDKREDMYTICRNIYRCGREGIRVNSKSPKWRSNIPKFV